MSFFIPLFGILFLSVFVWFFLISRLYKIIKNECPDLYDEMDKPTLFWSTSPRSTYILLKFILRKEYLEYGNDKLKKHGNVMFVFFVAYVVLFALLSFSMFFMFVYVKSYVE